MLVLYFKMYVWFMIYVCMMYRFHALTVCLVNNMQSWINSNANLPFIEVLWRVWLRVDGVDGCLIYSECRALFPLLSHITVQFRTPHQWHWGSAPRTEIKDKTRKCILYLHHHRDTFFRTFSRNMGNFQQAFIIQVSPEFHWKKCESFFQNKNNIIKMWWYCFKIDQKYTRNKSSLASLSTKPGIMNGAKTSKTTVYTITPLQVKTLQSTLAEK